jgi:hypothetical protein
MQIELDTDRMAYLLGEMRAAASDVARQTGVRSATDALEHGGVVVGPRRRLALLDDAQLRHLLELLQPRLKVLAQSFVCDFCFLFATLYQRVSLSVLQITIMFGKCNDCFDNKYEPQDCQF